VAPGRISPKAYDDDGYTHVDGSDITAPGSIGLPAYR
jgi:hypothetical protein